MTIGQIRYSGCTKDIVYGIFNGPPYILLRTVIGVDTKGQQKGYLALGKRTRGLVYAKGAGLPGIYQVRSVILTQIPDFGEISGIQRPTKDLEP